MFRRQHTTICREGWYYLLVTAIVFIGAMVKEVNLLLLLSGMMMGLLLFHWQVLFVSLSGMKLERKAPRAVRRGPAGGQFAIEQYPVSLRQLGDHRGRTDPTRAGRFGIESRAEPSALQA
jgi:hypothetical protein